MTNDGSTMDTAPEVDALVQVSFAVVAVLTRVAAELDLSMTQLRLLGILRDRTPTMAETAVFLRLDRSSVTGLVDRAERRGLVARRTATEDARVTTIELTDEGRGVGRRLAAAANAQVEALLVGVTPGQRAQLIAVAGSIVGQEVEIAMSAQSKR